MMSSNIDTRTIKAFFAIFGQPLEKVACAKLKKSNRRHFYRQEVVN